MKIVNIALTSTNGGVEQVFIDYCDILKNKLHHDVYAIVKNNAPYKNKLTELNIPFKTTRNLFAYGDIFTIHNIKKFLLEFDADVVLTHNSRANALTRTALKKIKNKKIFHIAVNHSMNVKRSIGADIIISINKPIFYRTIDAGQAENRSFIVSNGIDLRTHKFVDKKIEFSKQKVITLGVIGRFVKAKGFASAIKMLKILKGLEKQYNKKFILKIAGDGEEKINLLSLTKKLKLKKDIEFLGWVKNPEDFFNKIDVFILPSRSETFGLVLLESLKYSVPIISTNVDGPQEVLRENKDAIIVKLKPINNLETRLVAALETLLNNDELANQMIKNGRERLIGKFSFDAVARSLEEIIGKVVSPKTK